MQIFHGKEGGMKFNHLLLLSESSSIFPLACAAMYSSWFGGPAQRKLLQLVIGYRMGISRDPSLHLCRVSARRRSCGHAVCWGCELQVAQPMQGKKHLCWVLQLPTVQGDVPREMTLPDSTDPTQTLQIRFSWQPSPKEFIEVVAGLRGLVFKGQDLT